MSFFGTRETAASAVMAALVCATTMLIQVPIPATEGFFNIGDAMIMVSALTFGPIVGPSRGVLVHPSPTYSEAGTSM